MRNKRTPATHTLLAFSAVIVLLDQAAKLTVRGFDLFGLHWHGMQLYDSVSVLGDVVRFTYIENPGMAFGLNFDMPLLLSLFSIGASFFLVYLLRRTETSGNAGLRWSFALILGGAAGNLIDRVFYGVCYGYASLFHGRVVDFIDVDIPDITLFGHHLTRFYVFNIADAAVSVGVVLLLLFYPTRKQAQAASGVNPAPTPEERSGYKPADIQPSGTETTGPTPTEASTMTAPDDQRAMGADRPSDTAIPETPERPD